MVHCRDRAGHALMYNVAGIIYTVKCSSLLRPEVILLEITVLA